MVKIYLYLLGETAKMIYTGDAIKPTVGAIIYPALMAGSPEFKSTVLGRAAELPRKFIAGRLRKRERIKRSR